MLMVIEILFAVVYQLSIMLEAKDPKYFLELFIGRFKSFFFSFILLFSFFSQIYGQNLNDSDLFFIVDSIHIQGNTTTKEFVILNELTFKCGDQISDVDLNFNRERIYSLGLFNQVTVYRKIEYLKNIIIIEVEESWYIFPLPFASIKERDYKKLSYGFYLVYKNFRGRNETLFGTASFGYNPSFGITYINPNLSLDNDYFLKFTGSLSKRKNRSIIAEQINGKQFEFKQVFTSLMLGKRLNPFNKIFGNISFNYLEVEDAKLIYTLSGKRIDKYPQISLNYEFDDRDLLQFPKQGNYFFFGLNLNGLGINYVDYQSAKIDFRQYSEIYDYLYFKFRVASRFTIGNKIPLFDYSLIGAEEKIRGNFFKRIEDKNLLSVSAELYYPLVEELHLDLSFVPIIPNRLLSYRIAIFLQTFADYGSVFNKIYKSTNSLAGYGLGLSLLVLPYNVLRFEVGLNEKSQTEFIIDFGTSF